MVKKLCISLRQYTWDNFLKNIEGNRSEFLETYFLLGVTNFNLPNKEGMESHLSHLISENDKLLKKVKSQETIIENLKNRRNSNGLNEDDQNRLNFGIALHRSGVARSIVLDKEK